MSETDESGLPPEVVQDAEPGEAALKLDYPAMQQAIGKRPKEPESSECCGEGRCR